MLCEARLIEGLSDQEVRALFNRARDEDYDAIAKEARSIGAEFGEEPQPERRAEVKGQLTRLRNRLAQVVGIDFFGADRRVPLEGLLAELEDRVAEPAGGEPPEAASSDADALQNMRGRTWVTRQGVYVDRIASAWLIRGSSIPRPGSSLSRPKATAGTRGAPLRHVRGRIHAPG